MPALLKLLHQLHHFTVCVSRNKCLQSNRSTMHHAMCSPLSSSDRACAQLLLSLAWNAWPEKPKFPEGKLTRVLLSYCKEGLQECGHKAGKPQKPEFSGYLEKRGKGEESKV